MESTFSERLTFHVYHWREYIVIQIIIERIFANETLGIQVPVRDMLKQADPGVKSC